MKTIGIYKITNKVNGKIYVGSSKEIEKRFRRHKRDLELGRHDSRLLQRAWDKHGADAFTFEVIERVEGVAQLVQREQHWIDSLNAAKYGLGYNMCAIAGIPPDPKGTKKTPETRIRMSVAAVKRHEVHGSPTLGRKHSENAKQKIGAIHQGRVHSDATRAKMSSAAKKREQEHGNNFLGKTHSEETRAKLRAAWEIRRPQEIGKVKSDETRLKISEALKGRKLSEETKDKLRRLALERNAALRAKALET